MVKSWSDIPGFFDYAKTYDNVIEHLACPPSGGILVECGNYLGRSLCYLGQKVKESGKNWRIVGIDNSRGNLSMLIDNVWECGLRNIVSILHDDSVEAASLYIDNSISFVFLDTIHTKEHLSKEIKVWLPKVKVNGVIAGDDVGVDGEENHIWPEVKETVDELLPGWIYSPHDCWLFFKRS